MGSVILTIATHPQYTIISFTKQVRDTVPLVIDGVTGALKVRTFGPRTMTAAVVRRTLQDKPAISNESGIPRRFNGCGAQALSSRI
ncbi:hypothetical protein BDV35DRAFT_336324 [Aspergillus flavus]|uniref:Uncharacterized protein n=1 Tax=Aspergillus flavus TaxID=5059 RepID=A0A5N6HCZ9_ASPFL|nr:hypothetical protein BDV35DRAFT_336324 [Aspergillus flavus]